MYGGAQTGAGASGSAAGQEVAGGRNLEQTSAQYGIEDRVGLGRGEAADALPGDVLVGADQYDVRAVALAGIDEVGSDNVFVQYDFYHQQRMAGELLATFRTYKDRIAHIQIADNPGRNEPGTGEINYPVLFEALDREGYAGWTGCEYKPKAETSAGLGWFEPYRTVRASAT